jgi:cellulose synthase/poly-beta-1,6-N-acetylglucosamine synthase-like glycosyltransferase
LVFVAHRVEFAPRRYRSIRVNVSVIVPAFNAAKTIGACLDGLFAQTLPRAQYEVIVVDDGSTDATRAIAQTRGAIVVTQDNRGAGAARNTGAQNARGDLLCFIDADSIPDPRWLAELIAPFADATIAGASGEKQTRQTSWIARYVQFEYDFKYDRLARGAMDFVDSSTAAYRRDIFIASGGFDATLGEAEDVELSFRLAARGNKLILARAAIVWHQHPESLGEFLRRKYQYAIWRAVVYARFPRKAARDQRTPTWQKLQLPLAFALIPFAMGALVWNALAWAVFAILVLFGATTLPFAFYCWRRDARAGIIAPFVLLLTAYAGGAGAARGIFRKK